MQSSGMDCPDRIFHTFCGTWGPPDPQKLLLWTSYYGPNNLRFLGNTFLFFEGLDLKNVRTNFRFFWISINHDVNNDRRETREKPHVLD